MTKRIELLDEKLWNYFSHSRDEEMLFDKIKEIISHLNSRIEQEKNDCDFYEKNCDGHELFRLPYDLVMKASKGLLKNNVCPKCGKRLGE